MKEQEDQYEITPEGSLGLLALGARGVKMWRKKRDRESARDQGTRPPFSQVNARHFTPQEKSAKRLLLIGWDAADWQVIKPLLKQGKMPTLERLIQNGVQGNIATLQPALSPMLWTSIATGKRAYHHGILGFAEPNLVKGTVEPVKATSRKVKAVWNILNEAGLKTNVVNWWPSHPAEKINGVMISDYFHKGVPAYGEGKEWPMGEDTVFPRFFLEEIKSLRLHPAELTLAHAWPFIPEAHHLDPEKDRVLKSLLRILAKCCSVHNAVTHVMENTEWDMTAVYYETLDHFSHLAMKYHPPQQEEIDDREFHLYKGIVEAAYRFHDMMLQRLMDLAGDDCHIMLVSDHGFHSGRLRTSELPDLPAAPALEHRKYGIFAATGPDFRRNHYLYGSTLLDITPTILHFFGLPVGEDMEGRVCLDVWKDQERESKIPSWELVGARPDFINSTSDSTTVLRQLEEIGYIDLPESDKIQYVQYELKYNLCLSNIEGNRLNEAVSLAEELYVLHPDQRSFILWAQVLLLSGRYQDLQVHLNQVSQQTQKLPQIAFIKAQMLLYTGSRSEALQILREIDRYTNTPSVQLYNEIGKALMVGGLPEESLKYYDRSLREDPENAAALTGKGYALVEMHRFPEALSLLENSLLQVYYQPNAHYLISLCFYNLGKKEEAEKALRVCLRFAPGHQKAKNMVREIEAGQNEEKGKTIIVVSGLPRSGTSLMMQVLKAAGIEVLADGERGKDRHNPGGYLEYSPVRKIGVKADWMEEAVGKAVKVVSPLLRYLPATYHYKIIYMQRPLAEVVLSQEVMKGRKKKDVMYSFPFQAAADLQAEEKRVNQWLALQSNIDIQEVSYYDCLRQPKAVLDRLREFLKCDLSTDAGVSAVNPDLHRNKWITE